MFHRRCYVISCMQTRFILTYMYTSTHATNKQTCIQTHIHISTNGEQYRYRHRHTPTLVHTHIHTYRHLRCSSRTPDSGRLRPNSPMSECGSMFGRSCSGNGRRRTTCVSNLGHTRPGQHREVWPECGQSRAEFDRPWAEFDQFQPKAWPGKQYRKTYVDQIRPTEARNYQFWPSSASNSTISDHKLSNMLIMN